MDLTASGTSPAAGVALWATTGGGYGGGTLFINGVKRSADLTFETYAPAPSGWRLLTTQTGGGITRGHVIIAAFAANWLALGVVLRAFGGMSNGAHNKA